MLTLLSKCFIFHFQLVNDFLALKLGLLSIHTLSREGGRERVERGRERVKGENGEERGGRIEGERRSRIEGKGDGRIEGKE